MTSLTPATRMAALFCGATVVCFGATLNLKRDQQIDCDFSGKLLPVLSHGDLVVMEGQGTSAPFFRVYDRAGHTKTTFNFTIPGAAMINVMAFAEEGNTTLAAVGEAFDSQGRGAPYMAIVTPTHEPLVVRTTPYYASNIAIAPDKTVFTAGGTGFDPHSVVPATNFGNVIRHYDTAGHLINSFVPQAAARDFSFLFSSYNYLVASQDYLLWYFARDQQPVAIPYNGGLVSNLPRLHLPDRVSVSGIAITNRGEILASTSGGRPNIPRLYSLDSKTAEWEWMPLPENVTYLVGADEEGLVFRPRKMSTISRYAFE